MAYWGPQAAQEALEAAYQRILGRPIDLQGLENFGRQLVTGNGTMRQVVRGLGKSNEFHDRILAPWAQQQNWGAIIAEMYQRFLGRPPESDQAVINKARVLLRDGRYDPTAYEQVVDDFLDSDEYMQRWGEQGIPGYGQHPSPQR